MHYFQFRANVAPSHMLLEALGIRLVAAQMAVATGTNAPGAKPIADTPEEAKRTVLMTVGELWTDFLQQIPLIFAGIIAIFITWAVAAVTQRAMNPLLKRLRLRASLRELIGRLGAVAVWIIGLLVAMTIVFPDITPAKALTTLGLGSIAIGFAFKDIFENFFAGILLLWRFPFDPGDYIECEGIMGKVEDITIRNTLIRKTSGELVVVPNATLFKNPVHVLTDWPYRRVSIICGVGYEDDTDQARKVIQEAIDGCKTVRKDKPVEVFAHELADSSVNLEITWWTEAKPVDIRRSKDEVVAAVKRRLEEAGIEMPTPYRTVVFKGPLETIPADRGFQRDGEQLSKKSRH